MDKLHSTNASAAGAVYMSTASLAFAGTNGLQSVLPWQFGMSSTGMAFWQYMIASVLVLPLIFRIGFARLRTRHPVLHEARALSTAAGVHVFVYGFAVGVPIWQMVTLLATGPLFIIIGSKLLLGERVSLARIVAALTGFSGAVMVSGFGAENFTLSTLVPIMASALWALTDVLTKYLAREEPPETLTISLLVLMTPNHILILIGAYVTIAQLPGLLPAEVSTSTVYALPSGMGLVLLLMLGALTGAAQYLLSFAYKVADATYLQPFSDLKMPLTALIGWVFLGQAPSMWFWPGSALIISASIFLYLAEHQEQGGVSAGKPI